MDGRIVRRAVVGVGIAVVIAVGAGGVGLVAARAVVVDAVAGDLRGGRVDGRIQRRAVVSVGVAVVIAIDQVIDAIRNPVIVYVQGIVDSGALIVGVCNAVTV